MGNAPTGFVIGGQNRRGFCATPRLGVVDWDGVPVEARDMRLGPTTASVRTGAGGPQPPREGSTKQHTVYVQLALSCANVALELLAWHCRHGTRGLMNVAWTA
jgi:hypothetical protein